MNEVSIWINDHTYWLELEYLLCERTGVVLFYKSWDDLTTITYSLLSPACTSSVLVFLTFCNNHCTSSNRLLGYLFALLKNIRKCNVISLDLRAFHFSTRKTDWHTDNTTYGVTSRTYLTIDLRCFKQWLATTMSSNGSTYVPVLRQFMFEERERQKWKRTLMADCQNITVLFFLS